MVESSQNARHGDRLDPAIMRRPQLLWAPTRTCRVLVNFKMLTVLRRRQPVSDRDFGVSAVALAFDENGFGVVQQPVQQG